MIDAQRSNPLSRVRRFWSAGGLAVVATLAAAWYAIGVRPATARLDRIRQAADAAEAFLATEAELSAELATADDRRNRLVARHTASTNRADAARDEVGFLRWLAERAAELGVRVEDYRPLGYSEYGDHRGRVLQLSASGSYRSVCRVLDAFRDAPQLNRLTTFNASPTGEGDQLRATLRVELITAASGTAASTPSRQP